MHTLPWPLLAIADEETLGPGLVTAAAAAVRGGLPWLCLRARRLGTGERIRLGQEVLARCPDVFLTVHGDREAAEVLGAAGLHLPSWTPDLPGCRRWAEKAGRLWGVSCHSREELAAAAGAGAGYALLSPFRSPVSKAAGGPLLGSEGFAAAIRGVPLPVLALGGVTPEVLPEAARAGAAGAAVLGSLFQAEDVAARARAFRREAARLWPETGRDRRQSLIGGDT